MVDWSELLPELVLEIAKSITFYEDFISFSKVCSSWQSAMLVADGDRLPSRFPSLLLVDNKQQECQNYLMGGEIRKLQFPNTNLICSSSTGGWLLIIKHDKAIAKLFHPLFRREINLPDLNFLPDVYLKDEFFGTRADVNKVVLSFDPTTEDKEQELVVMIIYGYLGWLAFCRPGDSSWTAVQQSWRSRNDDVCYYKGKAYSFDGQGLILSCDLHSKKPAMLPVSKRSIFEPEHGVFSGYILPPLEDNHGKLLGVCRRDTAERSYYKTESFWIFECDLETGECSKVEDLGNRTIFVSDLSSSFIMKASECIKANCIYFSFFTGSIGKLDMGIYHLLDGTMEPHFDVQSPSYGKDPMWIAPPNF